MNKLLNIYKSCKSSKMNMQRLKIIEFKNDSQLQNEVINIYDEVEYQEIEGFGGAFTEASAYNYSMVSPANKQKLIQAYFDTQNGLGYNFCRTHINSCDFSLKQYTYIKDKDVELKTFNIQNDKKYIIPFIKDAQKAATQKITLIASPWSPPSWMKTNKTMILGGRLNFDYADCWANYFVKYIEAYKKEGIDIWGVTVQNEPRATQTWESCLYTAEEEARFIKNYLKPIFDKFGMSDKKIIVWDHNKERIYERVKKILSDKKLEESVWGIGFHWYSGNHFEALDLTHQAFPNKKLISTEFCKEKNKECWENAEDYARDMIGNFNNYMSASIDWNMILDMNGGPYHNRLSGCHAPITVDIKKDTIYFNSSYYAIAHFSKFVKKSAKRIAFSSFTDKLKITSFKNKDGEIIVIILNDNDSDINFILRHNDKNAKLSSQAHSILTLTW